MDGFEPNETPSGSSKITAERINSQAGDVITSVDGLIQLIERLDGIVTRASELMPLINLLSAIVGIGNTLLNPTDGGISNGSDVDPTVKTHVEGSGI